MMINSLIRVKDVVGNVRVTVLLLFLGLFSLIPLTNASEDNSNANIVNSSVIKDNNLETNPVDEDAPHVVISVSGENVIGDSRLGYKSGAGEIIFSLKYSEPMVNVNNLVLRSYFQTLDVPLTYSPTNDTYEGALDTGEHPYLNGMVSQFLFVIEGQDHAGNPVSSSDTNNAITLDLQAPGGSIQSFSPVPVNDIIELTPGEPLVIDVEIFDFFLDDSTLASFSYHLSGEGRGPTLIESVEKLNKFTYRLSLLLPQDMSTKQTERLQLHYSVQDILGNKADSVPTQKTVQVKMRDITPPPSPVLIEYQAELKGFTFSWDFEDLDQDLSHFELIVGDESPIQITPESRSFSVTERQSGELLSVVFKAIDQTGNESEVTNFSLVTLIGNPKINNVIAGDGVINFSWESAIHLGTLKHYAVYLATNPFETVKDRKATDFISSDIMSHRYTHLINDQKYYISVVAVNNNDEYLELVSSVEVIPEGDKVGPEIREIYWNAELFSNQDTIDKSGTWSVDADDDSGLSRLEVIIDDSIHAVDVMLGDGMSVAYDPEAFSDGEHVVEFLVYDVFDNVSTRAYTFNSKLALPPVPVIVKPKDEFKTGQKILNVEVQVEQADAVLLSVNNESVNSWMPINDEGKASFEVVLAPGDNVLTATSRNRAGQSSHSKATRVFFDDNIPQIPTQLFALAKPAGEISLMWAANTDSIRSGFVLYRSEVDSADFQAATRVNSKPLTGLTYNDLPLVDGEYYYWVTAISSKGIESEPTQPVVVVSDSTPPTASIKYKSLGEYDEQRDVFGRGDVELEITVSEPIITTPFVSLTTSGALQSIVLRSVSETVFQGWAELDGEWPTGQSLVTFSARDSVGNRGFSVVEGDTLNIDTQGPQVISITTQPGTPVRGDGTTISLEVHVTFDEAVSAHSSPMLMYQLGEREQQKTALTSKTATQWQATITLPSDAGELDTEWLGFSTVATDLVNNEGRWYTDADQMIEVYQGDLPSLLPPLELTAVAMAGGKVKLRWQEVPNAAGYQIYRQAEGEFELSPLTRVDTVTEFIDSPGTDGEYRYALATIRQANDQESIGSLSTIVVATADSNAPPPPQNVEALLTPLGIQISWDGDALESGVRYEVFRDSAAPILSVDELEAITPLITQTKVIDAKPKQTLPAYAVVAVDQAGNRSDISATAYLNLSLLPVREIEVRHVEGKYPEISWAHDSATLSGFEILAGDERSGIKLSDSLLEVKQFTDTGYVAGERRYTLIAEDINGERSLARSVLLPDVEFSFATGSVIKRNLFNKVFVDVTNYSDEVLHNQRLVASFMGHQAKSKVFTLQPGNQQIEMVFAGYADLPDDVSVVLSLEGRVNQDELVVTTKNLTLPVEQGQVSITLETRDVIRGGTGEFRYVISNPGDETLSMVTALNSGRQNSPDVNIRLLDGDTNTLTSQSYKQVKGDNIVTLSNRHTVLNVAAQERYTSEWIRFNVPEAAGYDAQLRMSIGKFYAHYGQETQQQVAGVTTTKALQLVDTPYYGTVSTVTPNISFGEEPIVITGTAVDRESGELQSNAALTLIIDFKGFERSFDLLTDEEGKFSYSFEPAGNETGKFAVSVIHPELIERPNQADFTIQRAVVSPTQVGLRMVKTKPQPYPLTVTTGIGTELSEVVVTAITAIPDGVSVTLPETFSLGASSSRKHSIDVLVDRMGPSSGEMKFSVDAQVVGEAEPRQIGIVTVQFTAEDAKPSLFITPTMLEFGATLAGSDEGRLVIENRGTDTLYAVQVELLTKEGFTAPEWFQNLSYNTYPQLKAGDKLELNLSVSPQNKAAPGIEEFVVKVSSANHAPRHIPVFVSLVEDGIGGTQFKIANIYTGTLDNQGRIIQGLEGASITLRNEAAPSLEYKATTDEYGEIFLTDVTAGSYLYWVAKPAHETKTGRVRIRPGLFTNQFVFLDYQVVKLNWVVKEIPLLDKYEIILDVDYVADVPAAVLVAEPAAMMVPDLAPGEVFNGEIQISNKGLVRAKNVQYALPPSNKHYRYELMTDALPEVIEAKQSIIIPYRITGLAPTEPDGTGTGGGCTTSTHCLDISSEFDCAGGAVSNANTQSCFVRRTCTNSGGGSSGGGGGGVWLGGWDSGSVQVDVKPQDAPPFSLPMCRVDCPDGCDSANNGGGQ